MRRKKHKTTRRTVRFFKINYGFREPYKVLVDGNMLAAVQQLKMKDLEQTLPDLLGGRVKLLITPCVKNELFGMGKDFKPAQGVARKMMKHKCNHDPQLGGAECIADCLGISDGKMAEGNKEHWWVATQDKDLRKQLQNLPGTPCIHCSVNGMHLEVPSEITRTAAEKNVQSHMVPAKQEIHSKALEVLREIREERATKEAASKFIRKKPKQPNPLSMKKKKPKAPQGAALGATGGVKKSRKRRGSKTKDTVAGDGGG